MKAKNAAAHKRNILIITCLVALVSSFLLVVNHTYADADSQTTCTQIPSQSTSSQQTTPSRESSSTNHNNDEVPSQNIAITTGGNSSNDQNSDQRISVPSNQPSVNETTTHTPSDNTNSTNQSNPLSSPPSNISEVSSDSLASDSGNPDATANKVQVAQQDVATSPSASDQNPITTDFSKSNDNQVTSSKTTVAQSESVSNIPTSGVDKDQMTVTGTINSTDPTIKQSSSNPLFKWLTNMTSAGTAALVYPLLASRQGVRFLLECRKIFFPRYTIDHTWSNLDQKYNPKYTKQFYTNAQQWYDIGVKRENLTVPFADGSGNASATYIAHPGSTKTIIYGQGWTTRPEWMGYVSKIFYDMGYNILMPYSRGQGSSDGEFVTFAYKDKQDWINWINKVNQINGSGSEVILYGQSMGADEALEAAAQKNLPSSVKAVVADCGYSTLPSLLYSLYTRAANKLNDFTAKIGWNLNGSIPLAPYDQFLKNLNNINYLLQGFNIDDASGITAVKNLALPTLFIATADDDFIPDSETKALYNASISKNKQLWILDGRVGGHASANNAVLAYQQHIQSFLDACCNVENNSISNHTIAA